MVELAAGDSSRRKPGRDRKTADPEKKEVKEGLGLTSVRLRERMVERLRISGIRDERVLAAMQRIPRHAFVDQGLASRAYEDTALPIGYEQTISQPYIVARMTEALGTALDGERVLEVGTGCGYQAAILACVAREVYSVERIRGLHERSRLHLRPLRLANLRLIYGDGLKGVPEAAPFDGMLIAAAAPDLPRALLEQLRVGGVAIAPLGQERQSLWRIVRTSETNFSRELLAEVRFVSLLAGIV
jgi:protein-L-isoaspartate(D-aspartate) O-methyltransferase